jgi:hypothetical protein
LRANAGNLQQRDELGASTFLYVEIQMAFVPVMWVLWGASFLLMLGVTIIASRMTRNEEAQIFLADSSSHVKSEQDAITAKINKIRPIKRATLGLVGLMTLVVAGYYVLDVVRQLTR